MLTPFAKICPPKDYSTKKKKNKNDEEDKSFAHSILCISEFVYKVIVLWRYGWTKYLQQKKGSLKKSYGWHGV